MQFLRGFWCRCLALSRVGCHSSSKAFFRIQKADELSELVTFRNLYIFHGKRFMIIDQQSKPETIPKGLKLDLIILSGNPSVYIDRLLRHFEVKLIVIDSSNSEARARKWKAECKRLGLLVHSVPEDGAIRINLN